MIQLYQFPFSHFCEKARWALDYKGVPYRAVNFLPGFHLRPVQKLAPKTCLPVLRDEGKVVQDSVAIIDYLDAKIPVPALTPRDPEAARQAIEWERYFDEDIGVTLRLWFYHHALPDRHVALGFLLQDAQWYQRPLFTLGFSAVRPRMQQHMNINADTAKQAQQRLLAALERLEGALDGRRFLVEDRFSRADLTACALLSPFCLPDEARASTTFPAAVFKLREELKGRPFYQWVRSVYDCHRHSAPADA